MDAHSPPPTHLFVYGTLRPSYVRLHSSVRKMQPPNLLSRHASHDGPATLSGFDIFDLGEYPGVVRGEGVVVGDVFCVESVGESVMRELDMYEGIGVGEAPFEYVREAHEVRMAEGVVTAWVYVYNWDLEGVGRGGVQMVARKIAGGDYVEHVAGSTFE